MEKMDKFNIDSHKLMFHPKRVNSWLEGEDIYPIYTEVGLTSFCNQKCVFCAFDYYKKDQFLKTECFEKFAVEAFSKGVKSMLFAGEGEPLLHPDIIEIAEFTKQSGIDIALSTNGVLFHKDNAERLLKVFSWVRFSMDSGCSKTYSLVHNTGEEEFRKIINNIKQSVRIKRENKYNVIIGVQFVLIPQNYKDIMRAVKIASDIGVDYLVFKPYSHHPLSKNKFTLNIDPKHISALKRKMQRYIRSDFSVIFRDSAFDRIGRGKNYDKCLSLPFVAFIMANGDIYPCSVFLNQSEYVLGNICSESFEEIWHGKIRKKIMDKILLDSSIGECRKACRLDPINEYLWQLKNPNLHVNFI